MSAFSTIAGIDVFDIRLSMPRLGVWIIDAAINTLKAPTGKVQAVLGKSQLNGFARVSSAIFGLTMVRLNAGAGGLGQSATPRHYKSVQVRTVLTDLLASAGESLSSSADTDVLATTLPQWTVVQEPIGTCLSRLCAFVGYDVAWRSLKDGTVWLGRERFKPVAPAHQLLQEDPLNNRVVIAPANDSELVLPGDKFLDRNVANCVHSVLEGEFQSQIWYEDAP